MANARPNVILIMCDQMRWDAAGFAGSSTVRTPHLDQLAANGVCFENAYCASPVCSPARASWLSGLYPHAHLQLRNYGPGKTGKFGCYLPHDCITIGDVLKAAGYCCGMVGPWHLGEDHRPQHGFTDFWCAYRYLGDYPDPLFDYFEREGVPNLYLPDAPGMTLYENTLEFGTIDDPRQQRTTWTVDRSIEFIQQTDGAPFFLFASIKDPHPRILVPPELREHYPEDQIRLSSSLRDSLEGKPAFQTRGKFRIRPTVTDEQFRRLMAYYYALITHIDAQIGRILKTLDYPEDQIRLSSSLRDSLEGKPAFQIRGKFRIRPTVTDEQFRRLMAYYYALITHIDAQIGRILKTLEERYLIDNTIVVFISDHGELLGDHGYVEKCLMYEASVRVPCLISWPEQLPSGTRVTAPLAGVDLMPTLIDLVNEIPPARIDGRSVAGAILNGRGPERQPIFAEIASLNAIYHGAQEPEQLAAHVMVRDENWKYIWNRFDIDELYDLTADPGEMKNVASDSDQRNRAASMREQIVEMICHTGPGPYEWCLLEREKNE